jgi:hypothetical protein
METSNLLRGGGAALRRLSGVRAWAPTAMFEHSEQGRRSSKRRRFFAVDARARCLAAAVAQSMTSNTQMS